MRNHLLSKLPTVENESILSLRKSGLSDQDFSINVEKIEALFDAALLAQSNAYAPYSKFKVGAALRAASGRIFVGANVENIAYPIGTCAEAGAIAAMIAAGDRNISEILILGDGTALVTPCGACRQRIKEFGQVSTPIHIAGPSGLRQSFTLGQLLPEAFGPDLRFGSNPAEGTA